MTESIHYPRISKRNGLGFGLDWKLSEEYIELVKKITPEFKEGMKKMASLTQERFGLERYNSHYPILVWDEEKGLTGIVLGTGCPCAKLGPMHNYYFHNIDTAIQALALVEMLSIYLNGLQILQD